MKTKCCTVCKEIKKEILFKKREEKRGGRRGTCNTCRQNKRRRHTPLAVKTRRIMEVKKQGMRLCVQCDEIKLPKEFRKEGNKCKSCIVKDPERLILKNENKELKKLGKRRCRKCREIKKLTDFHNGHKPCGAHPECKQCVTVVTEDTIFQGQNIALAEQGLRLCSECKTLNPLDCYRKNKAGRIASRKCGSCLNKQSRENRKKSLYGDIFNRIKKNSSKKGWDVEVTLEIVQGLEIPVNCPCCKKLFVEGDYSIDRVLNDLRYVKGNMAIICNRCNSLKRDGALQDFENITAYIREFIESSPR